MLNRILFPTDFSDNAGNALQFAAGVAQFTGADLILIHAQHVPAIDVQDAAMVLDNAMQELKAATVLELEALKRQIEDKYFLKNVSVEVEFGFARDLIIDKADSMHADLVIMGTKGSSDVLDNLLGSVTSHVMKGIHKPLMVVPSGAEFSALKKIAFASQLWHEDIDKLDWLDDFTKVFNPELHVIHVIKENQELNAAQREVLDKMGHKHPQLSMEVLTGNHVAESIETYISGNQINLLAMRAGERGFFEDLFHKSVTRHVAMHAHTPTIIFH